MEYLIGLGKTKYNSSVCIMESDQPFNETEIFLTERMNKKKNSGLWPTQALRQIKAEYLGKDKSLLIAENRDVHTPFEIEEIQDKLFPFYQSVQANNLQSFCRRFNPNIHFLNHHSAHAHAALAMSPFEKSLILVLDGAGTEMINGQKNSDNKNKLYEECTLYLQDGSTLIELEKRYVSFFPSKKWNGNTFGNQVGALYEKISEFVFNSPNASGKVMGLAPFFLDKPDQFDDILKFQEELNWDLSFKGKSKKEWELSEQKDLFVKLSAIVQMHLEKNYLEMINNIKMKYPHIENLILTGGCALNCRNNAKIYYSNLFNKIYVPPFPGDESIGFGLVSYLKLSYLKKNWEPWRYEYQAGYFGPKSSIPKDEIIEQTFNTEDFLIVKENNIIERTAKELASGKIIAWFQGRSESGPRALGNRSILASPLKKDLKEFLNSNIKFRENFRPYGCSVLFEKAAQYFKVDSEFNNPYMSFAIKVKDEYKGLLKEVTHVDGTSRMQTVRVGQNEKFYNLIKKFGELTNIYCLLNTSLNVMDQPILEDVYDAKEFLIKTPVDALVINDYYIKYLK